MPPKKALGIEMAAMSEDLRKRFKIKSEISGVVITDVDRASPPPTRG